MFIGLRNSSWSRQLCLSKAVSAGPASNAVYFTAAARTISLRNCHICALLPGIVHDLGTREILYANMSYGRSVPPLFAPAHSADRHAANLRFSSTLRVGSTVLAAAAFLASAAYFMYGESFAFAASAHPPTRDVISHCPTQQPCLSASSTSGLQYVCATPISCPSVAASPASVTGGVSNVPISSQSTGAQLDLASLVEAALGLDLGTSAADVAIGRGRRHAVELHTRLGLLTSRLQELLGDLEAKIDPRGLLGPALDEQLPDPSTVSCHMQSDSSDLCEYENVCFDIPSDESPANDATIYLLQSDTIDPESIGSNRPTEPAAAFASAAAWAAQQRANRHARRQETVWPGRSVKSVVDNGMKDWLTWDFIDVIESNPGHRPRVVPFGSRYQVKMIQPAEGIPRVLGGTFDGLVTWVDHLYMTQSILHAHLWGFSQSVAFPLFGAGHANTSLRLDLPPIDNLWIAPDRYSFTGHVEVAWNEGNPYQRAGPGKWVMGMLRNELEFLAGGAKPFSGSEIDGAAIPAASAGSTTTRTGEYPHDVIVQRLIKEASTACANPSSVLDLSSPLSDAIGSWRVDVTTEYGRSIACLVRFFEGRGPFNGTLAGGSSASASDSADSDTSGLHRAPFRSLLMQNTIPGTRMLFSAKDVPEHPITAAFKAIATQVYQKAHPGRSAAATLAAVSQLPSFNSLHQYMLRRPHRVCARRAVLAGNKDLLIGGNAEATYLREFAHVHIGTAPPINRAYDFPPAKVLLVDRGRDTKTSTAHYGRWFENSDEMIAVIKKYNVEYTVLTDADIYKMSFEDQARTFASHGLLIVAHGAGESTSAFMPPRSAVIEVHPYGMWCPVFIRMHTAAGNHIFPIYRCVTYAAGGGRQHVAACDVSIVLKLKHRVSCDGDAMIHGMGCASGTDHTAASHDHDQRTLVFLSTCDNCG